METSANHCVVGQKRVIVNTRPIKAPGENKLNNCKDETWWGCGMRLKNDKTKVLKGYVKATRMRTMATVVEGIKACC